MFFNPSIDEKNWPILEIGPGALPFHLSDVWLDIDISEEDRFIQSGGALPAVGKPTFYYDGKKFPFKDKAFKYVIASHVLEHVEWENVPMFIAEMERVAEAGYIELPRWVWELVNDIPTHKLTGDVKDERLILYKKTCDHDYNFFTKHLISESENFRDYIKKDKELFFCKIDWQDKINYVLMDEGYPIANGKDGILDSLKIDFKNLKSDNFSSKLVLNSDENGSCASFDSNILRRICNRINGKKEIKKHHVEEAEKIENNKKIIDNNILSLKILQCPICSGELSNKLHCNKCSFLFSEKDMRYYPHS